MIDATKFSHALVGLDEKSIVFVANGLKECFYTQLKDQLIRRLSVSETAKLNFNV